MQEEVTRGAVTLIVDGAKLSEQVFEKAVKKFLEEIQKSQKPKIYRGRQSLKQLAFPASCSPLGTASRQPFPPRGSVSIPRTC